MKRTEIDNCKQLIDEVFGEGMFDSILNIFGVNENDLENATDESDVKEKQLPSEKITDINKKMQIHKIVQEYTTENNISNDDYAKLFEFACWILMK